MTPSRAGLGFVGATRAAFGFLHDLGFHELSAEETIVRYASDRVFLNVYHGRASYEIGIQTGLLGSSVVHSLSALVRAQDRERAARFRNFTATTPPEIRTGLLQAADALKKYGDAALRGDPSYFALLEKQQRDWAQEYAADVAYEQMLPRADEAFRRHDYATAAKLYDSIRSRLSPAESKRLEYARKRS